MTAIRTGNWQIVSLVLLAALSIRLIIFVFDALQHPSHGFVSHYTASRVVLEGSDLWSLYDHDWFLNQVRRFEPSVEDYYGANLPTTAALTMPVAILDYPLARAVWTVASALLFIATLAWLMQCLNIGPASQSALFCLLLFFQPLYENLGRGQMYVIVFALLSWAWWSYSSRRQASLASALCAALLLKSAALMVWPLLAIQRLWRTLILSAAIVLGTIVTIAAVFGLRSWTTYLTEASQLLSAPHMSVTAYQSLNSLTTRLFAFHESINPMPAVDLPLAAVGAPWLAFAVSLGISIFVGVRAGRSSLVFAAFVLLSLMLSPVSLDYHYVVAILPIAIILAHLEDRIFSWRGLALAFGAVLIAADLPYRSSAISAGWSMIFAYPKLYGALLLWGLALIEACDSRRR